MEFLPGPPPRPNPTWIFPAFLSLQKKHPKRSSLHSGANPRAGVVVPRLVMLPTAEVRDPGAPSIRLSAPALPLTHTGRQPENGSVRRGNASVSERPYETVCALCPTLDIQWECGSASACKVLNVSRGGAAAKLWFSVSRLSCLPCTHSYPELKSSFCYSSASTAVSHTQHIRIALPSHTNMCVCVCVCVWWRLS